MWYAIIGGIGLAIGLGLLIWGLRERSARHKAERKADAAESKAKEHKAIAEQNAEKAKDAEEQASRFQAQISAQKTRLAEARKLLSKHGTVNAIRAWLDAESQEEEL